MAKLECCFLNLRDTEPVSHCTLRAQLQVLHPPVRILTWGAESLPGSPSDCLPEPCLLRCLLPHTFHWLVSVGTPAQAGLLFTRFKKICMELSFHLHCLLQNGGNQRSFVSGATLSRFGFRIHQNSVLQMMLLSILLVTSTLTGRMMTIEWVAK